MKQNGKNIIFDGDITMTGQSTAGKSLSDIISEQQSDIDKLKSNVKWLYKYGGVGSGGRGGSGSGSGDWNLYASLGGVVTNSGDIAGGMQISNNSITLSSTGDYVLYFKINRPDGASFRVTFSYERTDATGVKSTITNSVLLDVSNNYEYNRTISLNSNGLVSVTAVDSVYGDKKSVSANYITEAYVFNTYLVTRTGDRTLYSANEIYVQRARDNGLKLRLEYEIAVDYRQSYATMDLTFGGVTKQVSRDISGTYGIIDFDLDELFEVSNENSGNYTATTNIYIDTAVETRILTYTLISESLYLLVQPNIGQIYSENPDGKIDDPYMYNPGSLTFSVRPYLGTNTGTACTIRYYYYNYNTGERVENNTIQSSLGAKTNISIFVTDPGLCAIRFQLEVGGVLYPSSPSDGDITDGYINYFFYIKQAATNITWYDGNRGMKENYWRINKYTTAFRPLNTLAAGNIYQNTVNRDPVSITGIDTYSSGLNTFSTNIAIGIQFSEVNSENDILFQGTYNNGTLTETTFTMTQNKITIGSVEINYFLPKVRNYHRNINASEKANDYYHLVNIVARKTTSAEGQANYYEFLVYIDGIIEGAARTWTTKALAVDTLTINPCNAFINLLEVTYLESTDKDEDLNIYRYYLMYKNSMLGMEVSTVETDLLDLCEGFSLDGEDVFCDWDTASNVAQKLSVPTLVFRVTDNTGQFKTLMNAHYEEDQEIPGETEVAVFWSKGGAKIDDGGVTFPDNFTNAYFSIQIQGSSTKMYKCKNWTLRLNNRSEGEQEPTYVFSPNFNSKDPSTFLPEESFTLKADVVDSSHSNNTSIGRFVNTVTSKFNTKSDGVFKDYIKNCLDGFPCVVYIQIMTDNTSHCYYQGVYNFNLGRESYYNLGYKPYDVFLNASGASNLTDAGENFLFQRIEATANQQKKGGLIVAEIQGNSPYFDFSQWDSTILFKSLEGVRAADETYMFDDFEHGVTPNENISKNIIQNMVQKCSLAGGYLFGPSMLKKTMPGSDEFYGYYKGYHATGDIVNADGSVSYDVPLNKVPNYRAHIKKVLAENGSEQQFIYDESTTIPEGNITNLRDFIVGDEDQEILPWFDFRSLSEYYTICMAFGLVDSVQKNMNIKTWNATNDRTPATFYAAFYDMDTCLGINNQGTDVSYFAFSDYWKYDKSKSTSGATITPTAVTIYRDYSPESGEIGGVGAADFYDTPSSYLFAVAKYARMSLGTDNEAGGMSATADYPQQLWAKWRAPKSQASSDDPARACLSSAQDFIDNYFANNLGKVGVPLINLNYRNKYLIVNGTGFDYTNYNKFNGTRIAKATDWLDGRFHILDAYFNLPNTTSPIQYYVEKTTTSGLRYTEYSNVPNSAGSGYLLEPRCVDTFNLGGNEDIYVKQDIFAGNSANQGAGTLDINITAKEYSPLFINVANAGGIRYLLGGEETYHITLALSGTQTYQFLGSGAWTSLSSIDTFNFKSLNVNSKYLETLEGGDTNASMTISSDSINMPSLKTLRLTSANYTGSVSIDESDVPKFPNLTTVNVSNTSLGLTINNSTVRTVNISNMRKNNSGTAVNVAITNCKMLETVNFGNGVGQVSTTLGSCYISPFPVSMLRNGTTITNSRIENLSLFNTTNTGGNTTITINGDTTLRSLYLSGIANVRVLNCSALEEIIIAEPTVETNSAGEEVIRGDRLKDIYVYACGATDGDLKIGPQNVASRTIDLRQFSELEKVQFNTMSGFDNCELPAHKITLPSSAFANCYNMRTLQGGSSSAKLTITGNACFTQCHRYTLKGSDGQWTNLTVDTSVCNNLSSMFSTSQGGSIGLDGARYFVHNVVPNDASSITNISSMFSGQGIYYNETMLRSDLGSSTNYYIDMRKFSKVTNAQNTFAWCGISAWHKNMISVGTDNSVTTLLFHGYMRYSGTVATTLDVMENIIEKITYMWWDESGGNRHIPDLKFYSNNGTLLSGTIALKDFFHPNGKHPLQVTTIHSFGLYTGQRFDLTDCFKEAEWPVLNTISYSFRNGHSNLTGLDKLLYYVPKVKTINNSFNLGNSANPINLNEFMNWSTVIPSLGATDLFYCYGDWLGTGCFSMYKYIYKSDFNQLLERLLKNKNITGMSHFFKNCSVLVDSESDATLGFNDTIFSGSTTTNENIKYMHSTFYGLKMVSIQGKTLSDDAAIYEAIQQADRGVPVLFLDNFFKNLVAVSHYTYCFRGMYIGTSIPYDFFGRRRIIRDANNKYIKTGAGNTEADYTAGTYYYVDYQNTVDTRSIQSLHYCFADVKWHGGETTSAKYFQGTGADYYDGDLCNRFVTTDGTVYKGAAEADRIYYTRVETDVLDEGGNKTGEVIVSFKNTGTIGYNTEISDTEGLRDQGDYINSFAIEDSTLGVPKHTFRNFDVDWRSNKAKDKLFIAPDFFYPCKSSCNIQGVFANTVNETDDTLCGMIPEHLLKNVMNASFENMMLNLNIIPKYLWTTGEGTAETVKIYVYVPKNFTNYTVLSSCFNFHLMLPEGASKVGDNISYKKYYVLRSDSIPSNTSSLSNSLPSVGHSELIRSSENYINTHEYNYQTYYNVMYTVSDETLHSGVDGINMALFTSLRLDNLVPPLLAVFLNGPLFNDAFILNDMMRSDTGAYVVKSYGYQGLHLISRNLIFPRLNRVFNITDKIIQFNGTATTNLPLWKTQLRDETNASFYESIYDGTGRHVVVS